MFLSDFCWVQVGTIELLEDDEKLKLALFDFIANTRRNF